MIYDTIFKANYQAYFILKLAGICCLRTAVTAVQKYFDKFLILGFPPALWTSLGPRKEQKMPAIS